MMKRIGQWWCGFWGHLNIGVLEQNCWYLQCTDCGKRTAGWEIDSTNRPVPITAKQIDQANKELYDDIFGAELDVHGGG